MHIQHEALSLERFEELSPKIYAQDINQGAITQRSMPVFGQLALVPVTFSVPSLLRLFRHYNRPDGGLPDPENRNYIPLLETSKFEGADHQINGMRQRAATVDSFLATMYAITDPESTIRVAKLTDNNISFLCGIANAFLSGDEPRLPL